MKTVSIILDAAIVGFLSGCSTLTIPGPGNRNILEISIGMKERPIDMTRVVEQPPPKVTLVSGEIDRTSRDSSIQSKRPSETKVSTAKFSSDWNDSGSSFIPGRARIDPPPSTHPQRYVPTVATPLESVSQHALQATDVASRLIAHAYRRYTTMDYEETRCISDYVAHLTEATATERAAGCILSAAARYLEGQTDEAIRYFGRAKALAPYTKPSASVFPKEILDRYAEALPVHDWPRNSTALAGLPNLLRQVNIEYLNGQ